MTPGLARLMDEAAPAAPLPGLADELWRLVYTRGHLDVDRARPYLDHDYAGILVYARPLDAVRALLVVQTADRLAGAVGAFGPLPPVGSAVRLTAAPGDPSALRLIVDEVLPLGLRIRFDRTPAGAHERRWVGLLRDAVGAIRAAEAERRDAIALRRRALPALASAPSREEVVRLRVGALREQAERETAHTPGEAAELDALRATRRSGTYAEQRRAFERETELVRLRQERFDARVRAALDAFRSELPALHQRVRAMQITSESTRSQLQRLEDMAVESRARTRATFAASSWLDALAGAPFVVSGLDAPPAGLDQPARADAVLRAVALLARALPRAGVLIAV